MVKKYYKKKTGWLQTTANTCSAIATGFATFASAKPPANVTYSQTVVAVIYSMKTYIIP